MTTREQKLAFLWLPTYIPFLSMTKIIAITVFLCFVSFSSSKNRGGVNILGLRNKNSYQSSNQKSPETLLEKKN
jgi:hypothetical protein